MRRLCSILFFALAACGPPPTGTVSARISSDDALGASFITEDGWALTFGAVVIEVGGFTATGGSDSAFPSALAHPKQLDFTVAQQAELGTNASATPRTYDAVSIVFSHGTMADNVNVPTDVLGRAAGNTLYIEGTATRQSTTRQFHLGLPMTFTYDGCMPALTVAALGTATLDFRVHAKQLFFDDQGKMRFDAWALADASPNDGTVLNLEAAAVPTSTLPAAQYGATAGTLMDVLAKRARQFVGVGASGTCAGK